MNDAEHPTLQAAVKAVRDRETARTTITVPVLKQAHRWNDEARVTFTAPTDQSHPTLMIWEPTESAWRVIVLPAGSEWSIRHLRPALWTPKESA